MPESNDKATADAAEPRRRHRAVVWPLIVLASVLLVFSVMANWVQRTLLDTDQVTEKTTEILSQEDVQQQLSQFTVDQLYATVDVQGQIEARLPPPAQPLAAPIGAAARQLAIEVEEKALASPQVQGLISAAIGRAHAQFVSLVRDEAEYVSTTGGEVTLEYGDAVADLAVRLGLDPSTVSQIQGVVQELGGDLRQGLSAAQSEISTVRSDLSEIESGTLSSEQQQNLEALNQAAAQLQQGVAGVEEKAKGVESKVPDQLQAQFSELQGLLAKLDGGLSGLERRTARVLKDPSTANVDALDATLASLDQRITALADRQVVQHPGELVLMDSAQLDGLQRVFGALRNLGIVLPVLVLLLFVAAILLAKGWRRQAVMAVGGGILAATLLVLLARRLAGNEVGSLASSDAVESAVMSVWDILSGGLREQALFVMAIGLAFVVAGIVAGPGRHAFALRRFLAPFLREHPVGVYGVVAIAFLIWLAFLPGINNAGQVLVIVLLAVLAVIGVEVLRRQAAREFPPDRPGAAAGRPQA